MVQLVLNNLDFSSKILIELQGSLEIEGSPSNLEIGSLELEPVPTLIIGQHKLTGKKVELSSPFAVLQRKQEANETKSAPGTSIMSSSMLEVPNDQYSFDIVSLITTKYLFDARPSHIPSSAYRNLINKQ